MRPPLTFGSYALHFAPLQVREGRRVVDLTPRQLGVLSILVKGHGTLVSKQTLMAKVWEDLAVEEGNLTQAIFLIRRALGRLPGGGEYIETIPRKGYRVAAKAFESDSTSYVHAGTGDLAGSNSVEFQCSDERFRLLVNSLEDYAIYMLDCSGRVMSWNPGAEHCQGYTAREIAGQHFSRFFVPEDVQAFIPERELALATQNGRCVGEGWRLRKNGDRFWASFVLTAMRDAAGRLTGYSKVVRDLSERKRQEDTLLRTEAMLRRERDRLRAATESSMDAFFICEAVRDSRGHIEDFVFTYLNSNVEKMVSIPRERLLGGRMCDILPVNVKLGLFDEYRKVVLTGITYVSEFAIDEASVVSKWIRVRAMRLDDSVAITASDVTERKRLEEEVERLAAHDRMSAPVKHRLLPVSGGDATRLGEMRSVGRGFDA